MRLSIRRFRRNPFTTLSALAILAVGIGAILNINNILDALSSSRPLGIASAAFASIGTQQISGPIAGLSWDTYSKLTVELSDTAEVMACSLPAAASVQFDNGSAILNAELISNNYLQLLGAHIFPPHVIQFDETGSSFHVVFIRSDYARHWFGLPNNALDKTIKINGEPFRILGVVDAEFAGSLNSDIALWLPPQAVVPLFVPPVPVSRLPPLAASGRDTMSLSAELLRSSNIFYAIAKGKLGIDEQQLARNVNRAVQKGFPTVTLQNVKGLETDPERRAALVSWGKLALVLTLCLFIVAALNFSAFLVAQIPAGINEMTIRRSLGANNYHLIVELMRGPGMLVLAATVSGILIAVISSGFVLGLSPFVLKHITNAAAIPSYDIRSAMLINWRTVVCLVVLAVVGFVLIGILPAVELLREERRLATSSRATSGVGTKRVLLGVVACQSCLALASVLCAVFLMKGFMDRQGVSPGFSMADVLIARVETVPGEHPIVVMSDSGIFPLSNASRAALHELEAIIPLKASAMAAMVPLSGKPDYLRVAQDNGRSLTIACNAVTLKFFEALNIKFVQGRTFSTDTFEGTPSEAVVSRSLAQVLWPARLVLGNTIDIVSGDSATSVRITGVVDDVRYYKSTRSSMPLLYLPAQGKYFPTNPMFVVRGDIGRDSVASIIRRHIGASVPGLTVANAFSLEEAYYRSFEEDRMRIRLGCAIGAILLALATIGVYGITSFIVAARRRELAVRICMGARAGSLVRVVFQEIGHAVCVAVVLAILGWALLAKVLVQYMSVGSLWNPILWATSIAIWLLAIVGAALVPSIRVIRIHPAEVLRSE